MSYTVQWRLRNGACMCVYAMVMGGGVRMGDGAKIESRLLSSKD